LIRSGIPKLIRYLSRLATDPHSEHPDVIRRLSPPSLVTRFPPLRCTASVPRPSPLWPEAMPPSKDKSAAQASKSTPPSSQRGKNQAPGSGTPRGGGGGRGRSGRVPPAATTSSVRESSPFLASAFGSSPTFNSEYILPPPSLSESEGVAREEDFPAADFMEVETEAVAATSVDVPAIAASAVGVSAKEAAPTLIRTLETGVIDDPDLLASLVARAENGDKDALARLAYIKRRLARQEKQPVRPREDGRRGNEVLLRRRRSCSR
jgi:hypothetical protein